MSASCRGNGNPLWKHNQTESFLPKRQSTDCAEKIFIFSDIELVAVSLGRYELVSPTPGTSIICIPGMFD